MTTTGYCFECAEPIAADDLFCENCGAPHGSAPNRCAECSGNVSRDGWCIECGMRVSNGRDHLVERLSASVAAATDKGRTHTRNEDAFALAVGPEDEETSRGGEAGRFAAIVVCDGVSSTTDSDVAALAAACAARDLLARAERPAGSVTARQEQWIGKLRAAAGAAATAAQMTATPGDADPPSCTFVAGVVDGGIIAVGWVGDSRAYWLPDEPALGVAEQVTVDDSWASAQIAAGVPREVAEADRRAHAITKWLGADYGDVEVSTTTRIAQTSGWLLVCSDGLWNYWSSGEDLRQLVARQSPDPLSCAEALVALANEQGGHDNITVALARVGPEE